MIPVEVKLTPANFTLGRESQVPEMVVIHWWGAPSLYRKPEAHGSVVDYFHAEREPGSSAHVVASYQRRTQVVLDEDTAWHAGNWSVNLTSLGLELMPFDEETPPEQVRGTFTAAAEAIAVWLSHWPTLELVQHSFVSSRGTECPGRWGLPLASLLEHARRLAPFVRAGGTIDEEAPAYEGTVFMRNPTPGRVSSGYGPRDLPASPFHAGIDIAAAGGTPVVAAFAGEVTHAISTRAPGQSAVSGPTLAPGRSGNGVRIKGLRSGAELYGHITPRVKIGQKVLEGQLIGVIENPPSGIATGPHVHFETWADANNAGSHFDPLVLFRKYGVAPGGSVSNADVLAVQKFLKGTIDPRTTKPFYEGELDGVAGPVYDGAVKTWQSFRGLRPDGVWGPLTQKDLDEGWRPYTNGVYDKLKRLNYNVGARDGLFGPMLFAALRQFQSDNGLELSGWWDPATDARWAELTKPAQPEPPAGVFTSEQEDRIRQIIRELKGTF